MALSLARHLFLDMALWSRADVVVQSKVPEVLLEACVTCDQTLRALRQPKMVDLLLNNLRWYFRYDSRSLATIISTFHKPKD